VPRALITGGSGFLGRHLARLMQSDYEVVLGARNDSRNAEAARATGCSTLPLDVARIESVRDAFVATSPDLVIHAAATKHIDVAEREPHDCIEVNVLGSQNVARVAREHGVATVVGISTDKAAPPVRSTYGLSKALMERLFCALDDPSATRFTCVRLGNIAWSTGSVLELWHEMLAKTGVVGTTGPQSRRFFLTGTDAADVVLQAARHIDVAGGRVFVRPLKVAVVSDLLAAFLEAHGGRWERLEPRPHDAEDETLVATDELGSTSRQEIDGIPYMLIAPDGSAAAGSRSQALSSATAELLNPAEIARLVAVPGGSA
jgi:UDP-N-acetylglucosamine 4,6-dehydratase